MYYPRWSMLMDRLYLACYMMPLEKRQRIFAAWTQWFNRQEWE